MISFASDNHSGIHPSILKAIEEANNGHTIAYGDDIYTQRLKDSLKHIFKCDDSFVVMNGTGANVLSLCSITNSFNSVICAKTAHINVDECGSPEKLSGCKLIQIETSDGKLTPEMIEKHISGIGFQHHSQPKVVSISQPTELGTVYSVQEIKAIAKTLHTNNMLLHIDGARLSNAIAFLGCTPDAMGRECGVDVLSLGGTKNGVMIGEIVMFFNRDLCKDAMYHRKQITQLASKMRFISAQLNAYLKDNLYIELAQKSNSTALYLSKRIREIDNVTITQKIESNAIFAIMPEGLKEHLLKRYYFYTWNETNGEIRLMTSFDTKKSDIDDFISYAKEYYI